MNLQRLGIAALAVPAAAVTVAASPALSTPPPESSPGPSPTSVIDPTCAFVNGCTSPTPTPSASVQGASTGVPTPATGADPGLLVAVGSLPAVALGVAAIRWGRRRH